MNRSEFFRNLELELFRMPAEERQAALDYYHEYFDDAGEENEQKVLEELGSPNQLAAKIKADSAIRQLDAEKRPTVKKGISAVWLVILAIFAAPIALPLAIGGAMLAIGIIAALIGILAALIIGVAALFFGGIVVVVAGAAIITTSLPVATYTIGVGLAVLGFTILAGILVVLAARGMFGSIAKKMNRQLNKKSKGDEIDG